MNADELHLFSRMVVAFEQIAQALVDIHDTKEKEFAKRWPEPREWREASVTRVPTEEDLIREKHGESDETIEEWIGLREQDFLGQQTTGEQAGDASPEITGEAESIAGGLEALEGEPGEDGFGSPDHSLI